MQKQAPTLGRIVTMVLFALSCFGLLLFLWLSFGGADPAQAQGLPVQGRLPGGHAARPGGRRAGRRRQRRQGTRRSTPRTPTAPWPSIELDRTVRADRQGRPRDPAPEDAAGRDLRRDDAGQQARRRRCPTAACLGDARVAKTVELDEIFRASTPRRARASRPGSRTSPRRSPGRGRDLNDALGNLPAFADDGNDLLTVLDGQADRSQALVRGTGQVFGALTQDEGQLHNLIVNADTLRDHLRRKQELAETFRIFRPSSTSRRRPSSAWRVLQGHRPARPSCARRRAT